MTLKRNTIHLAIANGLVLLGNLLQAMVFSRLLAVKADFGSLQQVILISGLLVAFLASLPNALNYFSGKYGDGREAIADLIRRFSVAGAAAAALAALLIALFCRPLATVFSNGLLSGHRWMVAGLIFLRLFNTLYPNICLVTGRLRRLIVINLLQCLLPFALFLLRGWMQLLPVTLFLELLIVIEGIETLALLGALWPAFRQQPKGNSRFVLSAVEGRYVLFLLANGAVMALTGQADRLIISSVAGPAVYSDYSLGTIANPLIGVLLASVTTAFIPVLSNLHGKKDFTAIFALWKNVSRYAAALIVPLVFFTIIFGNDIIAFMFTEKYNTAGLLFRLYNCRLLFIFMLFSVTMNAVGLEKYTVINSFINLCSTSLLVYAGWKWRGITGAVAGSVAAIYIGYIFPVYIIRRKLGGRIRDYFPGRTFLLCCAVSIVTGGIAWLLRRALNPGAGTVVLLLAPVYYLVSAGIIYGVEFHFKKNKLILNQVSG